MTPTTKERGHTNEELIRRSRAGDTMAEEELILQNSALVHSIAYRFRGRGCEDEDLYQIGAMGLLRAARSFDLSRGVVFSTYAVPLIIGEIKRFLRDDGMIKVGRAKKQLGMQLYRAREELMRESEREPRLSEIAAAVGVDVSEAAAALDAAAPVRSLSDPISGDDNLTVGDVISEEERDIDRAVEKIALSEAMRTLSPIRRQIISLRYFSNCSQKQTADILGLTQVKISREEKRILSSLRKSLEGEET